MKITLNIIIAILVIIMGADIHNNIANPELHYSDTICALSGILFFGFFRVNYKEFVKYLNRRS